MALFTDQHIQAIVERIRRQHQALSVALGEPIEPIATNKADRPSPLASDLALLIQIANGEYQRTRTDAAIIQQAELALQNLLALLVGNVLHAPVTIPDSFWQTDLGILISRVRWWLSVDDLITISNAAALAFGENTQATRMRITRAMDKGQLAWIPDPSLSNPQQNKRVLRSQVEQWREQRQRPA